MKDASGVVIILLDLGASKELPSACENSMSWKLMICALVYMEVPLKVKTKQMYNPLKGEYV